jgi:hypothetical protein
MRVVFALLCAVVLSALGSSVSSKLLKASVPCASAAVAIVCTAWRSSKGRTPLTALPPTAFPDLSYILIPPRKGEPHDRVEAYPLDPKNVLYFKLDVPPNEFLGPLIMSVAADSISGEKGVYISPRL